MFGKKEQQSTIADYAAGQLICSGCHKPVSFQGEPPLSVAKCKSCDSGYNFVPLKIDNYWLFKPLGGGGMGSVYEAYVQDAPGQTAAVKILPRDKKNDPILVTGLEMEVDIMERLGTHPCIVSMIGGGYADDEYFLAMQCIHGERLDKRIQRLQRLPEMEVLMIGLRVLQGETHIYNQGYLFRDMKPENVIVNETGAFLFDYGICVTIEQAYGDMGDMVSGSPIYWPPERVMGEVEMARSEIYSIGMVLYHCIAGQPLFEAKEIDAMARKHVRNVRISNFDQKMKKISPDLAEVLVKMIAREPAKRYQSFSEVEYELTRIVEKRLNGDSGKG